MPEATLAAVVIVYSIGLVAPVEFRHILKIRRMEFIWALVALAGVVLLGTLQGIVVAIIVSLLALFYQVSNPPVHVLARKAHTGVFRPLSADHPGDETFSGLLMVRPEGRVFFANARRIGHKIGELVASANPKVLALDLGGVPDLEYTALKMLMEAEKRLREEGVTLWLIGLNPGVLEMVRRSPLGAPRGRDRMFLNMEMALARYLAAGNNRLPG
jgi:MFS superfamily sulfate permease-like transporter